MQLEPARIEDYLTQALGQMVVIDALQELGSGAVGAAALKAFGYGRPLRVDFHAGDTARQVVLRQINRNGFGRERDSDRIAEVWLDFHAFGHLPCHVQANDMVGLSGAGELISLGAVKDVLLLTDYAQGAPYADDLLRIRDENQLTEQDLRRARALAAYLADIHAVQYDDPLLWRRRLRDLVGHGEGIMGLADSYPADFALFSANDLRKIEESANEWRWRLKPASHRLCQVHGDFHPFNVMFGAGTAFQLLDRSRGEWGEAADDVSCMTINYLFFSLQRANRLEGALAQLYEAFWESYLAEHPDPELAEVIQPWFAWRALVLASPLWYPHLPDDSRRHLFTFAQRVLSLSRFDWRDVNLYI